MFIEHLNEYFKCECASRYRWNIRLRDKKTNAKRLIEHSSYITAVKAHFSKHYDELFGDDKKKSDKDQGVPVMHGGNNTSSNGKPENAAGQAASQQHESMTNQKPAENNGVKGTPTEQEDKKDTPAPVEDGGKEGAIAPPSIGNEETTIKPKEQSIKESDRTGESEAPHVDENVQAAPSSEQNPQSEEKKPSAESAETAEVV